MWAPTFTKTSEADSLAVFFCGSRPSLMDEHKPSTPAAAHTHEEMSKMENVFSEQKPTRSGAKKRFLIRSGPVCIDAP